MFVNVKKKYEIFLHSCEILCFSFDLSSQKLESCLEDNLSNSLDNSKWTHDIGTGTQYGLYGWGNGELQYYQSQNTTINNGINNNCIGGPKWFS